MPYEWTEERMRYWSKTLRLYEIAPRELNTARKALLVAQGFRCALCEANLSGRKAFLDHAHNSGEIRGVLCYRCNRFWVAKNSRSSSLAVVRYLNDPPAGKLLPPILENIKAVRVRIEEG